MARAAEKKRAYYHTLCAIVNWTQSVVRYVHNPPWSFGSRVRGRPRGWPWLFQGAVLKTNFYIDGFNLYYGAVKGTPNRWLNVADMCQRIFPKVTVNRIRYFTALVNGHDDPNAPVRQQVYLRALQTIPNLSVHLGFFLTKQKRAALASPATWASLVQPGPFTVNILKTEEKGSDVNIAAYLLLDGFRADYEQAVIISNDSDLCTPITMVQNELGLPVGFVNPHKRPAAELVRVARFYRPIRANTLAASQFPTNMTDATGPFSKPPTW